MYVGVEAVLKARFGLGDGAKGTLQGYTPGHMPSFRATFKVGLQWGDEEG